ncbi:peroxiredoxin [Roseisalinus antarcticus]|uniref:Glutathione-dependent peroxiredoxin n=1 Tax=Roseisalinus antarcticus TaxID=254357 RepID=A0A1Y5TDS3_9RHOB|nr:peroxiredoxin [Roseisalinus antarcticus]SLN58055.1 Putative peroxiredoxin [Roseisalinus antarcticus]
MTIAVGDTLPEATMLRMGSSGPEGVALSERLKGRKVALFGLPGAYTGTCTTAHVPSFIRSMDALKAKGVDEVICTAVNDPFVMKAWGESTGATAAGITMLADASGDFAKAIGMDFTAPPAGFYGRSLRYAMFVEDGVVKVFNPEEGAGVCERSAGETLVEAI